MNNFEINPPRNNRDKSDARNSSFNKNIVKALLIVVIFIGGVYFGQSGAYNSISHYLFNNSNDHENLPDRLDYSSLDDVYTTLKNNYDGEIDTNKLVDGAKKGLVEAIGDQYTTYFTHDEANSYTDEINGQVEGIGVMLGKNSDGYLYASNVIDGTPAAKSGIKNGDIIAKVDDTESISWAPDYAASKIRGSAGTMVKITVYRNNNFQEFTITRAKITSPSVTWEIKNNNIGYIRISRFAEDTAALAKKAGIELKDKNVKGIVLDLRNNGGGYVTAAQGVASLWIDSGKSIVTEKSSTKTITTMLANGDPILGEIKTVVLMDEYTASASEIVAGALKDFEKATLIGTKSYGKGVVQQLLNLQDGGQLKVTIAKWYTPKGTNIDHDGLLPDIEEVIDEAAAKQGKDSQLDKALDFLK